uniref:O-antigen ligase family protein n=1 Tax=Victivallis vadensis TaxID=172901 RepID=UPI003AF53F20
RLYRMILILLAVLIVAGGAVYIKAAGRGFASMEERVSYLNTSARMLAEKPLAGYGWGGFFYRHMQLKTTDSDESAHDPHNLVASFAAQTGVAGLAVVLAAILYPMFLIGRRVLGRKPEEGEWPLFALFWGEVAFFLHAMMEINLQIPATMAVAGAGLVSALITEERPETSLVPAVRLGGAALPVLAALAALWLNFRWIDAELKFDRLLSYARPMSAEDQKRPPDFAAVARLLRENDAAKPCSPFPWEAAGDYYLRFGDVPAAEHCYREALKRSECRPAIYRRLFEIEYARGDREAARKSLKRMYELFPTNPRYRELVERHFPELLAPSR